jgi:hypothetical protein
MLQDISIHNDIEPSHQLRQPLIQVRDDHLVTPFPGSSRQLGISLDTGDLKLPLHETLRQHTLRGTDVQQPSPIPLTHEPQNLRMARIPIVFLGLIPQLIGFRHKKIKRPQRVRKVKHDPPFPVAAVDLPESLC